MGKIIHLDRDGSGNGGSGIGFSFVANDWDNLNTVAPQPVTAGTLAYCFSSQGTKWLPGTLGGNYYPQGIYVSDGSAWVSDRNAIAEQLQINVDDIEELEANSIFKSNIPPVDTNRLWFNTNDSIIYFYDVSDWVSVQIYETVFNDQGATPNNTFLRTGNTLGNNTGIGYNLTFNCRVLGIGYNRDPNTAQSGQYWLYSNRDTGTNTASVIASFVVDASARGFLNPNVPTDINENNYITFRWNGLQTNNNVIVLRYRKKHL